MDEQGASGGFGTRLTMPNEALDALVGIEGSIRDVPGERFDEVPAFATRDLDNDLGEPAVVEDLRGVADQQFGPQPLLDLVGEVTGRIEPADRPRRLDPSPQLDQPPAAHARSTRADGTTVNYVVANALTDVRRH